MMPDVTRVPDACTLPVAEQPLRLAEWRGLLAEHVLAFERASPTRLVLHVTASAGMEELARDLARRETDCCSFFEIEVLTGSGQLSMSIRVPPSHAHVLDGLVDW